MTRATAAALLGALLLAGAPGVARAYSEHQDFAAPIRPVEAPPDGGVPDGGVVATNPGGGDGRYFTGSLEDGDTCAVCHVGAEAPADGAFEGLPAQGYRPGETYRLTLSLPEATRAAGAIEITDDQGQRVGDVALVPEADLAPADQCTDPTETAAFVTAIEREGESRVVTNVDACGAEQLRIDWTAPDDEVGPIWVHAVAVAGNGDGRSTPSPDRPGEADAVFEYANLLPFFGERPETTRVTSCSVHPSGRGGPIALGLLAAAGLALRRRRR